MERDRRQFVPVDEFPKPLCQRIGPQRHAVPGGEYEIVVLPLIANGQPHFKLDRSILAQHRDAGRWEPDNPRRGLCLWCIHNHPLPCQVGCALPDLQGPLLKVEVAPLQSA